MNKQELIEKIGNLDKLYGEKFYLALDDVLDLVKQLDEPQPVKVQQFVADWYEENKDNFEGNLYRYTYNISSIFNGAKFNEFERWFLTAGTKPFQTLVNMHQFGYEVEKEKRYTVVMKETKQPLYCNAMDKKLFFSMGGLATKFTRKQLEEAGFGWVFNCEGVEIEEVE